jgi:hypothetical protein
VTHSAAAMSVDVSSYFGKPVSLAAVTDGTADVLGELLGLKAEGVPAILVSAGWSAKAVAPLDQPTLRELLVGGPLPDECAGDRSPAFTIRVAGMEDGAYLMIMDHADEDDPSPQVVGYASPYRTCVGVVLALAVVLAIGVTSDGKLYEDWQLPMTYFVDELTDDPARFIELTRMPASASDNDDFAARCEQFLRRFPRMGGWPPDRSMTA